MNFNISTNILRDQTKDLKYIVTPNATKIFERIFNSENNSNKSFTIIGNYGTGKSTFLWALEKNLLKKNIFFSTRIKDKCDSYDFLKILGCYGKYLIGQIYNNNLLFHYDYKKRRHLIQRLHIL